MLLNAAKFKCYSFYCFWVIKGKRTGRGKIPPPPPARLRLKFSKAQTSKRVQSGRFLGSLLSKLAGPLMKIAMPLAKNAFSCIRN